MNTAENLEFYKKHLSDLYRIGCIGAVLGWDMNVCMPPGGAQARADQFEYISLAHHAKSVDPEFARVVDELFENIDSIPEEYRDNVRLTKRGLDIERKLPEDYIAESAQTGALSHDTWVKSRPKNDFAATKPYLEKLVELARRRADLIGYKDHPYDALLDEYDMGATLAVVKPLLVDLGEQLRALVPGISAKFAGLGKLEGHFDKETQSKLCKKVAEELGFDFQKGRLDVSPHPFMTSMGPGDTRITTRYDESDFLESLYGVMHETGHALFDMGLPPECEKYPPIGPWLSSSLHESQSRMWENQVGRSREFSVYLTGVLKDFFPDVAALGPDKIWMHVNKVQPSLIRTESDEVTYSLHIVIRMLLEEQLITGALKVADLPEAWGDMYEKYLGVRSPDDKDGVMQDTHWFGGGFGYFPTYALGNLYNAMMMDSAREAIPDLPSQIQNGEFKPLLAWLRENVHQHAMRYTAPELIKKVTGKELSAKPFVDYLKRKFE